VVFQIESNTVPRQDGDEKHDVVWQASDDKRVSEGYQQKIYGKIMCVLYFAIFGVWRAKKVSFCAILFSPRDKK
jgi:hypothetical protein